MSLKRYLKDKWFTFLLWFAMHLILLPMLIAFKIHYSFIIAIIVTINIFLISIFIVEYARKKYFYDNLLSSLDHLDKKYLVTEILQKPNFYEGEILYTALYEIDKAMVEEICTYKYSIEDFKEYIEMWVHEVKIPLSSLILMNHNKGTFHKKENEQIKRVENYVEQILYYVRSENAEKDYIIKECKLDDIINSVMIKYKDDFIFHGVDVKIENMTEMVFTDSKWLEFIIGQILSNCFKYSKNKNKKIEINLEKKGNKTVVLSIYDNGIGIPEKELSKVFLKSFTGSNGRKVASSTGMGLYICKSLCEKLGHEITIESKVLEFTKVSIEFQSDNFYQDVLK